MNCEILHRLKGYAPAKMDGFLPSKNMAMGWIWRKIGVSSFMFKMQMGCSSTARDFMLP